MKDEVIDFYLMHYVYFLSNGTERGEGNLYLATIAGSGVRKNNIENAKAHVKDGLKHLDVNVVVVTTSISYLTSCTSEEFYAD